LNTLYFQFIFCAIIFYESDTIMMHSSTYEIVTLHHVEKQWYAT